jgi:hypothetical protein
MNKLAFSLALTMLATPALASQDFLCKFASGDANSDLATVDFISFSGDDDWLYLSGAKKDDGSTFSLALPKKSDPPDSLMSVREGQNGYMSGGGYYSGMGVAFGMSDYKFTLVFVHPGEAYTFVYDCKPPH